MAFANFFDKAAMSASQILKGHNRQQIEAALSKQPISIGFDENALTAEGLATLDLLIRLLARLYPVLSLIDLTGDHPEVVVNLSELAHRINPEIEITTARSAIAVVVGKSKLEADVVFYIGSDGWVCKFSDSNPVESQNTNIPFGAGAAACFAAANIFKVVFSEYLGTKCLDTEFNLSIYSFQPTQVNDGPDVAGSHLEETLLVGLGAIGNGSLWALKGLKEVTGNLVVIDHEEVKLSNLQRYVMAEQFDLDHPKTDLASKVLSDSLIEIIPEKLKWTEFLNKTGSWKIKRVCVALDSADERINVQGALPSKILNAWTQESDLAVSRHFDFTQQACLVCLYLPKTGQMNKSEEIAHNLNLPEQYIRSLLANNVLIDEELLSSIYHANKIADRPFDGYLGAPIDIFYSEVVCGGVFMKMAADKSSTKNLSVPSAFESAFAGILLISELVIDSLAVNRPMIANITRFNMMKSLSKYIQDDTAKSTNCICQEDTWRNQYLAKWNS